MTGWSKRAVAALAVCCFWVPFEADGQGYGGPSLLSRGGNAPGRRGRAPIDFNVYASARGVYESGLIAPRLDETGELRTLNSHGFMTEVGAYGGRDWRRHSLGVDFRADYRHQTALSNFSGTNLAMSLSSQHRLSRRLMLMLNQTGGTSNRAFGGFAAPFPGSVDNLGVPINELFDVRIYYLQSGAAVGWQRSARTSLMGSADVFFIKRQSLALVNGQGGRVQGGVQHRISRATTLLMQVGFMRFEYPRVYSTSDIYTASFGVRRRVGRNVDVTAQGGVFMIRSRGVESVQLSPVVAEILGRPTGLAAFTRDSRAPMVEASMGYTQERGRFNVSARTGINPGNGVFLATNTTSVTGGYSYSGIRRMSLGVSTGYMRTRSVVLSLQSFNQFQFGGGFNYQLAQHINVMAQFDRRNFWGLESPGRSGSAISFGLAYTPSRFPISIF